MGLYGKIKATMPIAAVLAVVWALPCFAADKPAPPEDNDATYQLPMYIPKVIQDKMVYFGEDDVGNDELYTMEEPKKKPVPIEDNDNTYQLPGEYSPTRNKIKPKYKPPVYRPPVQQVAPQPQPVYQQQPVAQPVQQQQQYYQVPAQPQQQPVNQQYQYAAPPRNIPPQDNDSTNSPASGGNYPSYYQ
jgi:hypothetical protein